MIVSTPRSVNRNTPQLGTISRGEYDGYFTLGYARERRQLQWLLEPSSGSLNVYVNRRYS